MSWQYLKKQTKETLTFMKPSDMNRLLEEKQFLTFIQLHSTLADLYKGGMTLSEDMKDCLMHPFKLWGDDMPQQMLDLAHKGNKFVSADGQVSKKRKEMLEDITRQEAWDLKACGDFVTLEEVLLTLKNMRSVGKLNSGQTDFLDLAEHFISEQK